MTDEELEKALIEAANLLATEGSTPSLFIRDGKVYERQPDGSVLVGDLSDWLPEGDE